MRVNGTDAQCPVEQSRRIFGVIRRKVRSRGCSQQGVQEMSEMTLSQCCQLAQGGSSPLPVQLIKAFTHVSRAWAHTHTHTSLQASEIPHGKGLQAAALLCVCLVEHRKFVVFFVTERK